MLTLAFVPVWGLDTFNCTRGGGGSKTRTWALWGWEGLTEAVEPVIIFLQNQAQSGEPRVRAENVLKEATFQRSKGFLGYTRWKEIYEYLSK